MSSKWNFEKRNMKPAKLKDRLEVQLVLPQKFRRKYKLLIIDYVNNEYITLLVLTRI